MIVEDLHNIPYAKAWDYQKQLFAAALAQKEVGKMGENRLLFCEHPHVITIGKHGDTNNLLFNTQSAESRGVEVFQIDRGGDVTYHGPGQLVGYPVFDLETYGIGLRQYISNVEEIIIRLLADYGIQTQRLEGAAGVWLDTDNPRLTRKIAAIGVRSSRYITMHGFALNVNTDLSYFSLINPCGFVDKGVTSMAQELGKEVDMDEVKMKVEKLFVELFIQRTS